MMELNRRDFLKASGAGLGGIFLLGALSGDVAMASPIKRLPLTKQGKETTTICPYDGSGCGFIVMTDGNGKVINIEGDPDHPVNRGAACAKGASLRQLSADNPWRLSKPLYRAPGATEWVEKDWEWTLDKIVRNIKDTRDKSFIEKDGRGNTVNRTEAIANLGGSALDNEECYLLSKLTRALGIVYLEHHARI
ncbi:MAG: twin-arginine translocation signal domain-containing protein [Dehalococcoidales bacterium]|nr:twin-arginine translocation signal domain-containing protein [Dehalococcoidales bacterium]